MPISAHFLRTSAERTGADVSIEERTGGSRYPASSPGPSESGRKRTCHAARTPLARSTPRMLCANTHYPTGPSRATRPPRSASPKKVRDSLCLQHCEASFHQLEPTLSNRSSPVRLFQALQGSVHSTIGSLRCSSHSSSRVSFLPNMLPLRSGS